MPQDDYNASFDYISILPPSDTEDEEGSSSSLSGDLPFHQALLDGLSPISLAGLQQQHSMLPPPRPQLTGEPLPSSQSSSPSFVPYSYEDFNFPHIDTPMDNPPQSSTPLQIPNKSVSPNNNTKVISDYLSNNLGLPPQAVAGVLGVLYAESRHDPGISEIGKTSPRRGSGIAQWTGSRVTAFSNWFKKKNNISSSELITPASQPLETQLEYLTHELNTTHQILPQLRNASSPDEAAEIFYRGFENGGGGKLATNDQLAKAYGSSEGATGYDTVNTQLSNRIGFARSFFNNMNVG